MAWQGVNVLAVVPARGGSKTIPRKNLCQLGGISLVGRTALVCKDLPWIDRAIISTDDREIAAEGKKYGLEVPFMRPPALAADGANSVDMWRHAWLASEEYYSCHFQISLLLEPTSPLRESSDLERTISILVEGGYDAAVTVSRTPAHYTPHKCLTVDENGLIGFYLEEGARYSMRQFIPAYYHRNGVCYAVKRTTLVEKREILGSNCAAVIIDRPVVNIDDKIELEWAEFLLSRGNMDRNRY